ncbi:adenosylcobinamide-GDP ribazoletransferase [Hoyosella altamirensis]|uniref:Adenosylcobinamide-GDP ribazoletransferase n=1 Tax=Hoyosella altamirensis TaxID=616997 RepID=A0A839RS31_9ACTN|nr:adenosylcobinamide-GDP ribazoletransferase [Hoyosella altamirensis]MBB3038926.1 adenosylcobinamide-GDP ribazoletransferase [Hoyosella altamirensis]
MTDRRSRRSVQAPESAAIDGIRAAFSWLTILPVRGPRIADRQAGSWAIAASPFIGLGLGVLSALALWGLVALEVPAPLAGIATVALLALLTRGMHLDGLADTADGLGTYGPPEKAQAVMHSGSSGPFGVATLVLCLAAQAFALGTLAEQGKLVAVVVAIATARIAVVLACRPGIRSARPEGFGALVAGTQSWAIIGTWLIAAVFVSIVAVPDRPYQGTIVIAVALVLTFLFTNHCVRRFGGLNGDVLGAVLELTVVLIAVGMLVGG